MPLFVPPAIQTPAPAMDHGLPCDAKDHQALLIGPCTREEILSHRTVFKEQTEQATLSDTDRARWAAVKRPFTVVAAFGSWCGDSQRELPSFLKLEGAANAAVEVHFIGVARDKAIEATAWPAGIEAQKAVRVPTAWIFALGPGGKETLVGSVVEHPAKAGETFAESILDVMEQAK